MKLPIGLATLALVGAVVALVVAVRGNKDAVPGALKDCLRNAGVRLAKGPEAVGPLRRDAQAGRALTPRFRDLGEDRVALVTQPDYTLLVLRTSDNPAAGSDIATLAAQDPSQFSVVALAAGELRAIPAGCVDIAARDAGA